MSSIPKANSDRTLERLVKLMLAAVILTTLFLAGYYVNDRYRKANTPLVDREMQRVTAMVNSDPANPAARTAAGDVYLAKKMYDQAIVQYGEALKLNDKDKSALLGLGMAYMGKGDSTKMLESFDRIVELDKEKDYTTADKRLDLVYYYGGKAYLEKGQYDLAIERLTESVSRNPTDADAFYLLGNAYAGKGDYKQAIGAYRSATNFVPDFVDAYKGIAQGFSKLGDPARAGYANAMITFWSGDKTGALKQMEATAAQVTDDGEIFYFLGMLREDAGNKAGAAEAYRKTLELMPGHKLATEALARVTGQ